MSARPARKLRCAVYTRKSSEEGLEQEFNSLHAQREAGFAYISSQKSEGWIALPTIMMTAVSRAARWSAPHSSDCCATSRPA